MKNLVKLPYILMVSAPAISSMLPLTNNNLLIVSSISSNQIKKQSFQNLFQNFSYIKGDGRIKFC
ncbi:hypothetical protein [Spiroplasma endosymbiont of Tipula paludosa]|uniref:hypothetical protein n=1 Tax=Spiroplasma endosymbiont of Tipula paludosa TaxID=3066295 RepID=UPI0035C8A723